jgi:hypothetical protein
VSDAGVGREACGEMTRRAIVGQVPCVRWFGHCWYVCPLMHRHDSNERMRPLARMPGVRALAPCFSQVQVFIPARQRRPAKITYNKGHIVPLAEYLMTHIVTNLGTTIAANGHGLVCRPSFQPVPLQAWRVRCSSTHPSCFRPHMFCVARDISLAVRQCTECHTIAITIDVHNTTTII